MMIKSATLALALSAGLLVPPAAQAQSGQTPSSGRSTVKMETSLGMIWIAVDVAKAPVTACNFLRYVADGAYDGGRFFRSVRSDRPNGNPNPIDVIQAEAREGEAQPGYGPIPLERTSETGLTHSVGVISMARDEPDTATHNFFIVVRSSPSLNFGGARNPDGQGFAAFGRVFAGMHTVEAIQQAPLGEGESLNPAIDIRSAEISGAFPERCGV